ncbi:MAG: polysaccharide deacetylase family protein [Lysinibacillus sp.]
MRKAGKCGLIATIIFIAFLLEIKTTYFPSKATPTISSSADEGHPPDIVHSYGALPERYLPASFSGKVVALTFDDGPHPVVTKRILDILERHNAKATFFMVGEHVQYYPDIVREVFRGGHEIGNHTWSHDNLEELEIDEIEKEISSTNKAIQQIVGKKPSVFRPPYGLLTESAGRQITMQVTRWSVDTFDWEHKDADLLLREVENKVHDRAVILMHDIFPSTADGLEKVLQHLKRQGYTFVTVSELNNLHQK